MDSVPENMTLVEYIGGNVGSETWGGTGGTPSGRFYVFGANEADHVKYVDGKDLEWFLSRKQNGNTLFKLAGAQPATEPEPSTPAAEPEPSTPVLPVGRQVVQAPGSPFAAEPTVFTEHKAEPIRASDSFSKKDGRKASG